MSGKDRLAWEAMLEADLELRAVWDGYLAQLDRDASLIERGVQPTGQATSKAARRVLDVAGREPKIPAND